MPAARYALAGRRRTYFLNSMDDAGLEKTDVKLSHEAVNLSRRIDFAASFNDLPSNFNAIPTNDEHKSL
jgi:hypothetical protein